jgi:hypothetical protein
MSFQRFLVPVYYWKTVEIMITGVNHYENGSTSYFIRKLVKKTKEQQFLNWSKLPTQSKERKHGRNFHLSYYHAFMEFTKAGKEKKRKEKQIFSVFAKTSHSVQK